MNNRELIIDNFAGGGGASSGIEMATGRSVDIAINHDPEAIRMHQVNHPLTKHYCESVWDVDPEEVCKERPVALAWFSPDCKHFSKAKGGTPVSKEIRGLAWVAVRWAKKVKPRVIILENVEEFKTWGPLKESNGKLYPDPNKKGQIFNHFIKQLRKLGYEVSFRELRACDYGAPTIRKRFFMIARCDGKKIIWPEPSHGNPEQLDVRSGRLDPWRTAAEIINWSLPCPSIFESAVEIKAKYGIRAKRPLAENTMKRIAAGLKKYVIDNPDPFIVQIGQTGFCRENRSYSLEHPLTTIVSKQEHCLVTPYITQVNHSGSDHHYCKSVEKPLNTITARHGYGIVAPFIASYHSQTRENEARGQLVNKPIHTVDTNPRHSLVTAFITKYFTGAVGSDLEHPLPTVIALDHNAIITSNLIQMNKNSVGQTVDRPINTITAGANHFGEVRAFLTTYYGSEEDIGQNAAEPLRTITSKDRFGLVTVQGVNYQIVDIGLRMLEPRELFDAQGFESDYIIDHDAVGNRYAKKEQVARCGNAVPPPFAKALVEANLPELCREERTA